MKSELAKDKYIFKRTLRGRTLPNTGTAWIDNTYTLELNGEQTLGDLCEEFRLFLTGCGFSGIDRIDAVMFDNEYDGEHDDK